MNIIDRSDIVKDGVALIHKPWIAAMLKADTRRLRREIAPVALTVPLSCLDGGMRQVVESYKAGVAALKGSKQ